MYVAVFHTTLALLAAIHTQASSPLAAGAASAKPPDPFSRSVVPPEDSAGEVTFDLGNVTIDVAADGGFVISGVAGVRVDEAGRLLEIRFEQTDPGVTLCHGIMHGGGPNKVPWQLYCFGPCSGIEHCGPGCEELPDKTKYCFCYCAVSKP